MGNILQCLGKASVCEGNYAICVNHLLVTNKFSIQPSEQTSDQQPVAAPCNQDHCLQPRQ